MKRTWIILSGLLLLAAPAAVQAQFTDTTNADNTLTITGYTGTGGEVTIPATIGSLAVADIGTNAFAGNTNLASVTMPTNVVNIESLAFSQCSSLTNIIISENVTNIGEGAFGVCTSLASVTIPPSVAVIGSFAFIYCSSLTGITIPAGVESIGQAGFQNCTSLTNLTIASGVTNIGDVAFASCSGLKSVTIPGSVSTLGVGVFEACASLLKADFSNGVTSVGEEMFQSCPNMNGVTLPASVTNIGASAFAGTRLAGVALPGGLLSIGADAFAESVLTNVSLPAGLLSIGDGAFSETRLASLLIPASVTSIGANAFSVCSELTNISVAAQNSFFSSSNGVLFDFSQATLLDYPDALGGAYSVPGSVKSIAEGAFAGCSLSSVTLSAGVTNIGVDAFYDSTNLAVVFFEGDAPATDATAFTSDNFATIYYLPGATGWSSPFAGLTAVQIAAPSLRIVASKPDILISWPASVADFVLEQTASLARPVTWSPVTNSITVNGTNNTVTINAGSGSRYYALIATR